MNVSHFEQIAVLDTEKLDIKVHLKPEIPGVLEPPAFSLLRLTSHCATASSNESKCF